MNDEKQALRFNEGKIRYDLLPNFAIEEMAKVFTKGAEKYAERNWEKGMAWSKCIASLKRHIAKFERGEDFDEETGLYHIAHAMTNCSFLLNYYKLAPQFDDRQHKYLSEYKIGLDIDDVICDFVGGVKEKYGFDTPYFWNWSYKMSDIFKSSDFIDFMLNLKPKINPKELPFEPHCYITSRSIPTEITQQWIEKNGFPCVPVHTVDLNHSKLEVAKKANIDLFVDDKFENFVELNKAGIFTFLLDMPHNQKYNVGYKRIYSLKELQDKINM